MKTFGEMKKGATLLETTLAIALLGGACLFFINALYGMFGYVHTVRSINQAVAVEGYARSYVREYPGAVQALLAGHPYDYLYICLESSSLRLCRYGEPLPKSAARTAHYAVFFDSDDRELCDSFFENPEDSRFSRIEVTAYPVSKPMSFRPTTAPACHFYTFFREVPLID